MSNKNINCDDRNEEDTQSNGLGYSKQTKNVEIVCRDISE